MELAIAGVAQSFEVTFEPANDEEAPLPVAMSVYDTTNGTPTLVAGPTAMVNVPDTNTYTGQYLPTLNHAYLILKAVYTDGTFQTFDSNYSQGSETIFAIQNPSSPANPPSALSIIGLVNTSSEECNGFGFPIFTVFLGDVKPLPLKAMYPGTYNPLDLTECTNIVVNITNTDGSVLQLSLEENEVTITGNPELGQFIANFTAEQSADFLVGELQNIDVTFTIAGEPMTIRYYNCFTVLQVS